MVTDIKYLPGLGKSDHLVIDFSLICYTVQEKKCSTEKRNFFKGDYESEINSAASTGTKS